MSSKEKERLKSPKNFKKMPEFCLEKYFVSQKLSQIERKRNRSIIIIRNNLDRFRPEKRKRQHGFTARKVNVLNSIQKV